MELGQIGEIGAWAKDDGVSIVTVTTTCIVFEYCNDFKNIDG